MEPTCPVGQELVRDGASRDYVCAPRSYASRTTSPSASATGSASSSPPAAAPAVGTVSSDAAAPPATGGATPGSTGSPAAGACGGSTAQGDSVRVVDKGDATPSLGDASANVADSSYALAQATFYRAGASASPVRSLRASLDVSGPTFTVNARDSSVAGLPDESMTFLLASGGVLTKTCESVHGPVSAWFFPFAVGGTTQAQVSYGGGARVVRLIVSRADGATELVFAR